MKLFAAIAQYRARLAADCRGISAVEFALLMPVILTLFLGSVEASQGIATDRKVELTAHALADLASQYTAITNADMSNILNAGSAIIAPYAGRRSQGSGVGDCDRSQTAMPPWCGAIRSMALSLTVGQTVTVPSSLATPNSYLILAQVQFGYNPAYGYVLTGTLSLSDQSLHAAAGIDFDRAHGILRSQPPVI